MFTISQYGQTLKKNAIYLLRLDCSFSHHLFTVLVYVFDCNFYENSFSLWNCRILLKRWTLKVKSLEVPKSVPFLEEHSCLEFGALAFRETSGGQNQESWKLEKSSLPRNGIHKIHLLCHEEALSRKWAVKTSFLHSGGPDGWCVRLEFITQDYFRR